MAPPIRLIFLGTGDFAAVLAAAESTLRPAVSQQPAGKPGPIAKAARRAKAATPPAR